MGLDPLVLARIQFAANISFHILFPTITVGLCWILLYFRLRHTFSIGALGSAKDSSNNWEYAYYFWVKIFALTFALGVVSGITMSFQFGTNWPGFMERAGNVAGPLLGYEVLTAFFLEASFLGVMLFGKQRVSNRVHLLATLLVALGTTFSAFWILSLNSWMQTPAGFDVVDNQFIVRNWWEVIFSPSFPYRFAHMLGASLLTAAFLVTGVSAARILKNVHGPGTQQVLKTGVVLATVLVPLQIILGDLHGLNTLKHQPAKIAAVEAIWETERGAALTLFGFPDEDEGTTHAAIAIPKVASLILTHELDGEVQGLNAFPNAHPPVAIVFWSFRIMVGMGLLMLLVSWSSTTMLMRKKAIPILLLRVLKFMTFSGWIAVLAGWYVTEVGRQPWIVYGQLAIADVVADHGGGTVLTTLVAYLLIYTFLLFSYVMALRYLSTKPAQSLTAQEELFRQKFSDPQSATFTAS